MLNPRRLKLLAAAGLFIILGLIEVFGGFGVFYNFRGVLRNAILTPARPLVDAANAWLQNLERLNQIEADSSNLKNQIALYQLELSEMEAENARLDFLVEQSNYQTIPELKPHLAEILPNSELVISGDLRLWVGDAAIKPGDWVVANGFIIGRLEAIDLGIGLVKTIYSPKSELAVLVSERGGILRNSGGLTVEEIAVELVANFGDKVFILNPSLGLSKIPVGTLAEKISDLAEPAQRWRVTNPVDISQLDYVLVYPVL